MKAPSGTVGERQREREELLRWAALAIQNGLPQDAERVASDVLKADAGSVEAAKLLGYALMLQDRAVEAVAPLEKAARASRNPAIETQLSIALRHAGKTDKALIWLKRAVTRTPPFAPAFDELGYLLKVLNKPAEAIAVLKQGVAVAPMMTEMWIRLGLVCADVNDRAGARSAYAQALAINPVHPDAIKGLTSVLMHEGDHAGRRRVVQARHRGGPERCGDAHRARSLPAGTRPGGRRLCLPARGGRSGRFTASGDQGERVVRARTLLAAAERRREVLQERERQLERFQAKWDPVRRPETRQDKTSACARGIPGDRHHLRLRPRRSCQ